jgi:hypothetical protein
MRSVNPPANSTKLHLAGMQHLFDQTLGRFKQVGCISLPGQLLLQQETPLKPCMLP